uniref:Uncharacterized protein n=1 Tax=Anguilla anguilla TaxID=7936 RepID=A0A0E9WHY9_ANGAN
MASIEYVYVTCIPEVRCEKDQLSQILKGGEACP